MQVVEKVRIETPAADRSGRAAEELRKPGDIGVGKPLALPRRVADGEADFDVPVPRPAAPPADAGRLRQLFDDLEPAAGFVALRHLPFQEIDIRTLHQRVVLQQPGGRQRMLLRQLHLPADRLEQIRLFPETRLDGADEVDDVDDIRIFHEHPPCFR